MFQQFIYLIGVITVSGSITTIVVMICRVLIAKADAEKTVNEYHYRREIEAIRSGQVEYIDRQALPPGEEY